MKVCVQGLWHLGSVTAGCLASLGHDVVGLDLDEDVVEKLRAGNAPLYEPGLDDLVRSGIESGRLRFSTQLDHALRDAEIVWVAYDTPVDESDEADVEFVMRRVELLFAHLTDGAVLIISSQLPVGSARTLAERFADVASGRRCYFVCSPENLRLGKAVSAFLKPDRIVVGVDSEAAQKKLAPFLGSIADNIIWMDVESAEMTKHAINAFLATSVAFANEIATVCELVGADAREVVRGLKSEPRIGPKAYLSPGGPFAGGTLARDIGFLNGIAVAGGAQVQLLNAVKRSNDWHKTWALRKVENEVGDLGGRKIGILGLTYKSDTNTLRRSSAIELATGLYDRGAEVVAFDPRVVELPDPLSAKIRIMSSVEEALKDVSAAVVMLDDSKFKVIDWIAAVKQMRLPIIIDPNGALLGVVANIPGLRYVTVGLVHGSERAVVHD